MGGEGIPIFVDSTLRVAPPAGAAWKVDGNNNYILDGEENKIAVAT